MAKKVVVFLLTLIIVMAHLVPIAIAQATSIQASEAIEKSKGDVEYLTGLGINTERFDDLLNDARAHLEIGNYEAALEKTNEIRAAKSIALSLNEKLAETGKILKDSKKSGADITFPKSYFDEAKSLFEAGNYELAEQKLTVSKEHLNGILKGEYAKYNSTMNSLNQALKELGLEISLISSFIEELSQKIEASNYSESAYLRLIMINESGNKIIEAKNQIKDAELNGIPTVKMEDLARESIAHLEIGNFERSISISNEVLGQAVKGTALQEKITGVIQLVNGSEIPPSNKKLIMETIDEAMEKFLIGDFDSSLVLVESSLEKARSAKSSSIFSRITAGNWRIGVKAFFIRNWIWIAAFAALGAIFGKAFYNFMSIRALRAKISRLKGEHEAITSLIKKLQHDYYNSKSLSRYTYELSLDRHQERLLKINEILPVAESRLARILGKIKSHNPEKA